MEFTEENVRNSVRKYANARRMSSHIMDKITDDNIHNLIKSYLVGNPNKYPPLNQWDVSNVTNMEDLFKSVPKKQKERFNENIENWDVSNVTNMSSIFNSCKSFNQPLNSWNVSKVIDMSDVFADCKSFNQPLDKWDVSNVTDMSEMFFGAESFNQSLNNWNVSNVYSIREMFSSCKSFNQPLNSWNVSNVIYITELFCECKSFNQPLDNWDVSNVTDMNFMFYDAESFNQPLDKWDVSNVTNMSHMFYGAKSFNQPLNSWNVSNVTDFNNMFLDCKFNQSLDSWNLSEETEKKMFKETSAYLLNKYKRKQEELRERTMREAELSLKQSEESPYEECLFCAEPLDNISGPGSSSKCESNCNDVVYICRNNHIAHRGCILQSCNAEQVDVAGQMGSIYSFNKDLAHKNNCPFCRTPLLLDCVDFKTVSKIPNDKLPMKNTGGKKRRRKTKRRKSTKRKRQTYKKKYTK